MLACVSQVPRLALLAGRLSWGWHMIFARIVFPVVAGAAVEEARHRVAPKAQAVAAAANACPAKGASMVCACVPIKSVHNQ